jgi:hypothetical protein
MVALRFSIARAALAAGFLACMGCSVIVKTDAEQCEADADCGARGAEFAGTVCLEHVCQAKPDPKWGCIGHIDPPKGGAMIDVAVQLVDLVSGSPVKGAAVKLCSKYDPPCNSPLGMPEVGADGFVSAKVARDFQGYFDVQLAGYLPSMVFLDAAVTASNPVVQLVTPSVVDTLASGVGVTRDPAAGIVLSRTVDCQLTASAGVSISIFPSAKETAFYLIASGVSPGATATDRSGDSGFINVAPGTPTVSATRGQGGELIGKVTTLVRAGTVTYQLLPPTPLQ